MAPAELSFEQYWPVWPESKASSTLVLVDTNADAFTLFKHFFGPQSRFQADAHTKRGNWDYFESEWEEDVAKLPALPGGFSWKAPTPALDLAAEQYQARTRKVRFQSTASLKTEELQRCRLADPARGFLVDCTVCVTAPYSDCFRAVCRYNIVATGERSSQLHIEYAMAYAKPMSRMITGLVERGAESGLAKNFAQVMKVLGTYAQTTDSKVALPLGPSPTLAELEPQAVADAASPRVEPPPSPRPPSLSGAGSRSTIAVLTAAGTKRRMHSFMTQFMDEHLLDVFLPIAETLYVVAAQQGLRSSHVGVQTISWALTTLFIICALQLLLLLWHLVGRRCAASEGALANACSRLYGVVDMPSSVAGLVGTVVMLMGFRAAMRAMARQVMKNREATRRGPQPPEEPAVTVADAAPEPSGGAPAPAAADTPATVAEIATEPPAAPQPAARRRNGMARFLHFAVGGDAVSAAQPSIKPLSYSTDAGVMMGHTPYLSLLDNISRGKPPPASPKTKPEQARDAGKAEPDKKTAVRDHASSTTAPLVPPSQGPSSAGWPSPLPKAAMQTPPSSKGAAQTAQSPAPTPEQRGDAASPLQFVRRLSDRMTELTRGGKEAEAEGAADGGSVQASASSGRHLQVDDGPEYGPGGGVVVEEVYENERKQPIRGWGHLWPGHFLPTDPVGHWCSAGGAAFEGPDRVEGWVWCQDWEVDVSGAASGQCDAQGWYYAFDFPYLPYASASGVPGTGCGNVVSCVRRRRWVRTRVSAHWLHQGRLPPGARLPPSAKTLALPPEEQPVPALAPSSSASSGAALRVSASLDSFTALVGLRPPSRDGRAGKDAPASKPSPGRPPLARDMGSPDATRRREQPPEQGASVAPAPAAADEQLQAAAAALGPEDASAAPSAAPPSDAQTAAAPSKPPAHGASGSVDGAADSGALWQQPPPAGQTVDASPSSSSSSSADLPQRAAAGGSDPDSQPLPEPAPAQTTPSETQVVDAPAAATRAVVDHGAPDEQAADSSTSAPAVSAVGQSPLGPGPEIASASPAQSPPHADAALAQSVAPPLLGAELLDGVDDGSAPLVPRHKSKSSEMEATTDKQPQSPAARAKSIAEALGSTSSGGGPSGWLSGNWSVATMKEGLTKFQSQAVAKGMSTVTSLHSMRLKAQAKASSAMSAVDSTVAGWTAPLRHDADGAPARQHGASALRACPGALPAATEGGGALHAGDGLVGSPDERAGVLAERSLDAARGEGGEPVPVIASQQARVAAMPTAFLAGESAIAAEPPVVEFDRSLWRADAAPVRSLSTSEVPSMFNAGDAGKCQDPLGEAPGIGETDGSPSGRSGGSGRAPLRDPTPSEEALEILRSYSKLFNGCSSSGHV